MGYRHARGAVPEPLSELFLGPERVALSLWGAFLRPVSWNATADAMYRLSEQPGELERNPLVRLDDPRTAAFFGDAFDACARTIVSAFFDDFAREQTSYALAVLDRAERSAHFRALWKECRNGSCDVEPVQQPAVRYHPQAGRLATREIALQIVGRRLSVLIESPADEESRAKFALLRSLGRPGR
jgi:hypothetical protein